MPEKTVISAQSQAARFAEAALELECNPSEAAFDAALRQVATAPVAKTESAKSNDGRSGAQTETPAKPKRISPKSR